MTLLGVRPSREAASLHLPVPGGQNVHAGLVVSCTVLPAPDIICFAADSVKKEPHIDLSSDEGCSISPCDSPGAGEIGRVAG